MLVIHALFQLNPNSRRVCNKLTISANHGLIIHTKLSFWTKFQSLPLPWNPGKSSIWFSLPMYKTSYIARYTQWARQNYMMGKMIIPTLTMTLHPLFDTPNYCSLEKVEPIQYFTLKEDIHTTKESCSFQNCSKWDKWYVQKGDYAIVHCAVNTTFPFSAHLCSTFSTIDNF